MMSEADTWRSPAWFEDDAATFEVVLDPEMNAEMLSLRPPTAHRDDHLADTYLVVKTS